MCIADYEYFNKECFTFVSQAHDTVSWLDHVVTTYTGYELIANMTVEKDFVSSDHLPVGMTLNMLVSNSNDRDSTDLVKSEKVYWSKLTKEDYDTYRQETRKNTC